jgi:hypothetical protein
MARLRRGIIEIPLVRLGVFGHLAVQDYDMTEIEMQNKMRLSPKTKNCLKNRKKRAVLKSQGITDLHKYGSVNKTQI